jgi:mono/diheme cytochrome c family protein
MKFKIGVVIIAGLVPFHLFHAVGARSSVSAQQPMSVWGGIYTEDQAKRGAPLYAQRCAACHGADLTGGEMAPALADSQFKSNWNGLSVGDLFERIRVSMPQDNPGSLSRQQYADIIAFIFSKGEFPAGKTELSTKTEELKLIAFEATKP